MKKLLFILLFFCLLGCSKEPKGTYMRSYIAGYCSISDISFRQQWYEQANLYEKWYPYILICAGVPLDEYAYNSTDKDKKRRYDELCIKHNDMTFRRYWVDTLPRWEPPTEDLKFSILHNRYLEFDFVSIEIESDSDWDETHPAWSSLADVFRFRSRSPYPFIKSGYKDFYYDENYRKYAAHPMDMWVSELRPENMILLGDGDNFIDRLHISLWGYIGELYAPTPPTLAQRHNIRVTIRTDEGPMFWADVPLYYDI